MKAAVEGIGADKGLFVPTSNTYVFHKMRKVVKAKLQFLEEIRLRMLQTMCEDDQRLGVETLEFGTTRPQTLETLKWVALVNPNAEVFFLIGADKLNDRKRWPTRQELLDRFGIVAFERNGERAQEKVKVGLMEQIIRAKFAQHPELASRLLATGDLPLVEGNSWHDTFWGVDARSGEGENHLGRILMKVRAELEVG